MNGPGRSLAVIVRAHEPSPKLDALIASVSGGRGFDAYVSVNETAGAFDTGPLPRVPYTVDTARSLGFAPDGEGFLVRCSDVLFEHYRRTLPGYDHYALVEYDVELMRPDWCEALAAALRSARWRDLDLAGAELSYRGEGWAHHAPAARLFDTVWMVFFPVVVLSARGIRQLYRLRLQEGPRTLPTTDRVFCEAFVGSALATDPRFLSADLNAVVPGTWARRTFYWGLPMLMDHGQDTVALRHPVYAPEPFLHAHMHDAIHRRTVAQFRGVLRSGLTRLDAATLDRTLAETEKLASLTPSPPVTAPAPLQGCAALVMAHRERPGLDDRPAHPALGGSLLAQRLAQLRARQVVEIVVCLDASAKTAHAAAEAAGATVWTVVEGESALDLIRRMAAHVGERDILVAHGDVWSEPPPTILAGEPGVLATAVAGWPSGIVTALEERLATVLDQPPWLGQLLSHTGWMRIRPGFVEAAWPGETLANLIARLHAGGRLTLQVQESGFEPLAGAASVAAIAGLAAESCAIAPTT